MNFNYEELKSPNGYNVKESTIKKKFPTEYQKILQYSKDFQLTHLPFVQLLWIYLHDTKGIPKCKSDTCENPLRFESFNCGHVASFCSKKCSANSVDYIEGRKKTNLERYGATSFMGSAKGMQKIKNVMLEKYGVENIMHVEGTMDKIKQSMLKNHGVENAMYLKKFQDQAKETNIKNNDGFHLTKPELRARRNKTYNDKFLEQFKDYNFITSIGQTLEVECKKCNSNYQIYRGSFRFRVAEKVEPCTNCNPINAHDSYIERQLISFIETFDIPFLKNDRTVIKPKELDVYIPSKKLALELNGLLWHSDLYVEDSYHVDKTNNCLKKGVQLLHIYENEWNNNQEIVKSIIRHKLNLSTHKIFAKRCSIVQLSTTQTDAFLHKNHIFSKGIEYDFSLGLIAGCNIAAVMTFKAENEPNNHTITSFCSVLDTVVVGGMSKLFKGFQQIKNPLKLTASVDRRYFNGFSLKALGFDHIGTSDISFQHFHRTNRNFDFARPSELTEENGYSKIFNCGLLQCQWSKTTQANKQRHN